MSHNGHEMHPSEEDHGSHNGDGGHAGHGNGGHAMAFNTNLGGTVLFEFWTYNDTSSLIVTLIIVFLLGLILEGIKFGREWLLHRHIRKTSKLFNSTSTMNSGGPVFNISHYSNNTIKYPTKKYNKFGTKMFSTTHIIQSILYFFQYVLSMMLMLVFMTFNVYICLALSLGVTIGYFLFGMQRETAYEYNDCCS